MIQVRSLKMIQEEVFSRTETKKKIMRYRLRVKRSAQSPSLSDSKGGKAANDHPALQLQSHPGLHSCWRGDGGVGGGWKELRYKHPCLYLKEQEQEVSRQVRRLDQRRMETLRYREPYCDSTRTEREPGRT